MALNFICGPMMSGKSTRMLQYADRVSWRKPNKCLWVHNSKEVRSGSSEYIFTNGGNRKLPEGCVKVTVSSLAELVVAPDVTHVFIDEVQFYSDTEVERIVVDDLYHRRGLYVYASGLLTDCRAQQWPAAVSLIVGGARLEHLTSVCVTCGDDNATMTQLLPSATTVPGANPVKVGGAETYRASCKRCFTPAK